jgi:hypothetical protein
VLWRSHDPQAAVIAAQGRPFTLPVRMRRGEPNCCHGNAADLWARDPEKYQLVTGYALSDDGLWRSHSWVVDDRHLYETTCRCERYFGAALGPLLAWKFWFENFCLDRFRDGGLPPSYLEDRPGLRDVMRAATALPPDELFRRLLTAQLLGRTA